ncbi:MAG TPA: BON domain-containing protein [Burkholderiaceae bacterium]|nr:BON domain-containing protein [Burkholderiaceae bacterium]
MTHKASTQPFGRGGRHVWLAAALAALQLSACAPLVVGGAMVGGTMVAIDRRTTGTQLEDQSIESKASNRVRELMGDRAHVNVTSYNRAVLLTGEAPTEADKAAIEQAVQRVENVRSTVNELAVMLPSSMSTRSNDSFLTTKVKATYVDAKDLQANAFKVVTERSNVYLMGRVTEREATRATDLARTVSGVQKVVRVFEIVTEAELAEVQPKTDTTKK